MGQRLHPQRNACADYDRSRKAGARVLVEKPMAVSDEEANR